MLREGVEEGEAKIVLVRERTSKEENNPRSLRG